MQLLLRSPDGAHITIRNLSFPATAIISPVAGSIRCSHRGHSRLVGPAQQVALRPFTPIVIDLRDKAAASIDVLLAPSAPDTTHGGINDGDPGSASTRPLTRRLARHVFAAPQRDWNLDMFSRLAGLSKPMLSRRLFAEGTSFREAVRTHRLTRLLLDLPHLGLRDHTMAARYGFADRCQFEEAVFEHFGLPLARLRRLAAQDADGAGKRSVAAWEGPAPQFRRHAPPTTTLPCERPPAWVPPPCQP